MIKKNINFLKYKKMHKNSIKSNFLNKKLNFKLSKFFLISICFNKITYKQIETARRSIIRKNLKFCFIFNRIRPYFYYTKKSKKARMGKGVGKIQSVFFNLKPGVVVLEIVGLYKEISLKSIKSAIRKLPGFYKIYFK